MKKFKSTAAALRYVKAHGTLAGSIRVRDGETPDQAAERYRAINREFRRDEEANASRAFEACFGNR